MADLDDFIETKQASGGSVRRAGKALADSSLKVGLPALRLTPASGRVMLSAMLAPGCAVHMPPARSDSPEYVTAIGQQPGTDDKVRATAANIVYSQARGLLYGTAGLMSGLIMLLTWGQGYDSASERMHGP